ncbi:MAG: TolC family outer membrane protein [Hyphomicrobiaceae bacterium]
MLRFGLMRKSIMAALQPCLKTRHLRNALASAALLACGLTAVWVPSAGAAETLHQALSSAYRSNPAIMAQRRSVEATDEGVSQAHSGFRPRVIGNADAAHVDTKTDPAAAGDGSTKPRGYTIQLTQSVFQGFQSVNAVRQAEANVLAARETLRSTEQSTLLSAVTAYMDVIRDRAVVRLRENNVRVLTRELRATQDRFKVGDVSRTDVAQSEARRARSVSDLDLAKANLRTSRAAYQQFIGHLPSQLREPPPVTRNVPGTIQEGIRRAMEESPGVVSAAFLEKAAAHNVDQITGQLLPTVDLEANYTNRFEPSAGIQHRESASLLGRLNFPFYQGGEVYSLVRQARRTREQRAQEIEDQRRIARANLVAAWSQWQAAKAQLKSDRIQVRANRTALSGVRAEENVGQRSILDVLDAEQELLDAQVSLVQTKRDLVVASYSVLSATGRLTASDLGLNADIHNPEIHYGMVRRKAWGTRVLTDEEYDGYVVTGWDATVQDATRLADDVRRMTREAHEWAISEIHREDRIGEWDGETIVEGDEVYK